MDPYITEQRAKEIITDEIEKEQTKSQFKQTDIPFHIHNGQDAPAVHGEYIDFSNFMTWGQVTLSGGSTTITNQNIQSTSTIVVTATSTLAFTLSASCSNGSASIGSGVGSEVVNYIIIY